MEELLKKKLTLTKKGADGKYQAVAWVQRSDKYPDSLSCSISVERMKALIDNAQGRYVYVSVFVDDADEKKEEPKPTAEPEKPLGEEIPF
jgi:hypothetical protein